MKHSYFLVKANSNLKMPSNVEIKAETSLLIKDGAVLSIHTRENELLFHGSVNWLFKNPFLRQTGPGEDLIVEDKKESGFDKSSQTWKNENLQNYIKIIQKVELAEEYLRNIKDNCRNTSELSKLDEVMLLGQNASRFYHKIRKLNGIESTEPVPIVLLIYFFIKRTFFSYCTKRRSKKRAKPINDIKKCINLSNLKQKYKKYKTNCLLFILLILSIQYICYKRDKNGNSCNFIQKIFRKRQNLGFKNIFEFILEQKYVCVLFLRYTLFLISVLLTLLIIKRMFRTSIMAYLLFFSKVSKVLIPLFRYCYEIKEESDYNDYSCFNEFFIRGNEEKLKEIASKFNENDREGEKLDEIFVDTPNNMQFYDKNEDFNDKTILKTQTNNNLSYLYSPADSRVAYFSDVSKMSQFYIKGEKFCVQKMINENCTCGCGKIKLFSGRKSQGTVEKKTNGFGAEECVSNEKYQQMCNDQMQNFSSSHSLLIFRLAPSDYHHFHSSVNGRIVSIQHVPNEKSPRTHKTLKTVHTRAMSAQVLMENYRVVIGIQVEGAFAEKRPSLDSKELRKQSKNEEFALDSEQNHNSLLYMVVIGAPFVASIVLDVVVGQKVKSGEYMGYFGCGGSTVCLTWNNKPEERSCSDEKTEKSTLKYEIRDELTVNTHTGYETYVRVGDLIGRKTN